MIPFQIHQLADELSPPETGKRNTVLVDNDTSKSVLFAFAPGSGLAEHVAPLPATIHILQGDATLTVVDQVIEGKPGTWIQMQPKTPHSIQAKTPVMMLLTLYK
jgi:quercetin dioxygenase-like cupin family protein